jgi:hypothetical protein
MTSTHHEKAEHKAAEHPAASHLQPSSAADAARKFREQQDAQQKAERERNAKALGMAEEKRLDRGALDAMVKAGYEQLEQRGKDPHNMPGNVLDAKGERPAHKSTLDLEDITGNPGHRGVTPYAPATSINRAPGLEGPVSINEPPDVEQPSAGAATDAPAVYDEKWEREDDDRNEATGKKKHR